MLQVYPWKRKKPRPDTEHKVQTLGDYLTSRHCRSEHRCMEITLLTKKMKTTDGVWDKTAFQNRQINLPELLSIAKVSG